MRDRENETIALVTFIHKRVGFRDPPFSLLDFCAAFQNYELQPADLPAGFNGELIIKGQYKIVRYRSRSKPSTNRFAIGHEIGHGFLHEHEEFQCKVSSTFSIYKKPAGDPREWEADFFSAELLMPMPVVDRFACDLRALTEPGLKRESARLSQIFGVSKPVMKARLADLEQKRTWECECL